MGPDKGNKAGERAGMTCKGQLTIMGLSSLEKKKLRIDFTSQLPEEGMWRERH